MARVTLHTNDPVILNINDEEKCVDMFGEDFLQDYGVEIPNELLERYTINWLEFLKIQKEIEKYHK
jgi:hypothetical protein